MASGKGKSIMDSIFGTDFGELFGHDTPVPTAEPVFAGISIIRIRLDQKKLDQLAAGRQLEFLADGQIVRLVPEGLPDEL